MMDEDDLKSIDDSPQYYKGLPYAPIPKGKRPWLPNAIACLILGIMSIVAGLFQLGIPGIVCSLMAFSYYKKDKPLYDSDPEKYEKAYRLLKIGRTCAIWGIPASILGIVLWSLYFYFIFSMATRGYSYDYYDYDPYGYGGYDY